MRRPNIRPARQPHDLNRPTVGYFRTKRGRGQPWVPALVYEDKPRDPDTGAVLDRAPVLRCIVDGEEADLESVWNSLHRIDEAAYRMMAEQRLDPQEVPDFGQGGGYNSRDAELAAAADAALECAVQADYNQLIAPQWFRRAALLVKQISICEQDLAAVYKTLAKPLQDQLETLRTEHHSEAGDLKPALRAALTSYAERFGIDPCPETSPYWSTRTEIIVDKPERVPRKYTSPDMQAIRAALKRGENVPGVRVKTHQEIVIV